MTDRSAPALDLMWSLWSELGVPGPRRDHAATIVDPERLLLATPWLARDDARLLDLVFSWCVQHAALLSGSRLTALLDAAHPDVAGAARAFLAELAGAGVVLVRTPPTPSIRSHREIAVASARPSLLRLRVRALVGVGGRADLLVALLAAPVAWSSAASLVEEVGLAKRQIARMLAELAAGGVVHSRLRGNVREVRLARPAAFAELVAVPPDAVFVNWGAVLEWMRIDDELRQLPADRPATRRVEVAKREDMLVALAAEFGLSRASDVVAWAAEHARAFADGTSFRAVAVG